jgi:hypothetical protein
MREIPRLPEDPQPQEILTGFQKGVPDVENSSNPGLQGLPPVGPEAGVSYASHVPSARPPQDPTRAEVPPRLAGGHDPRLARWKTAESESAFLERGFRPPAFFLEV